MEKSDVVVNCISRQYETLHSNFNNVHCEIPKNIAKVFILFYLYFFNFYFTYFLHFFNFFFYCYFKSKACRETGVPRFVHLSALGAKSKHESNFLSSKVYHISFLFLLSTCSIFFFFFFFVCL